MTTIHLGLAVALAATVALTLLAVLPGLAAAYRVRLVDRLLLADLAAALAAAVIGVLLLVTGSRPADPLHFLYAAVALGALPTARYLARTGTERRRAAIMAIGCLVMAGVVVRLFMTGS